MSSYPGYSGGGGSDYDKEVDLSLAKVNLSYIFPSPTYIFPTFH